AVIEARQMGIPVIAVTDTNCDPTLVDYPIPGNDDALKSIKLFVTHIANAVEAGKAEAKDKLDKEADKSEDKAESKAESSDNDKPAAKTDKPAAKAKATA